MYTDCFGFIVSTITIWCVIDSMLAWINFCLLDLLPPLYLASSFRLLTDQNMTFNLLTCFFFCQSACLLLLTLSLNFSSLSLDLSVSLLSFAYWKSTFVIFLILWICGFAILLLTFCSPWWVKSLSMKLSSVAPGNMASSSRIHNNPFLSLSFISWEDVLT